MKIDYFCPAWGSEALSREAFFAKVKAAGYDGVEYALPAGLSVAGLDTLWELAEQNGLKMIAQHFDTNAADFNQHYDLYADSLNRMADYPVVRINSQTGKDFFSFEQNAALIDYALDLADDKKIAVSHETHRGKFSYSAQITKSYIFWFERLRITLDLSHWVNVSESYLCGQEETLANAISRTDHIHARVGYPQGPQVPDPRVPEWQEALGHHLGWWDRIVDAKKAAGEDLTIAPEFGPYPYLIETPGSRQPLADQWEVNCWMMNLLRERYA
jgi:sugar phosphate isomerase/epimerase